MTDTKIDRAFLGIPVEDLNNSRNEPTTRKRMSEIISAGKINAFFQLNSHLDNLFEHHAGRHDRRLMESLQQI